MLSFLDPIPARPDESTALVVGQRVATCVLALALVAAALGSGNPDTPLEARPPAWLDLLGNGMAASLAVLILLPRIRVVASAAAIVLMVVSMGLNVAFDGPAFFLAALPFNATTMALSSWIAWRQWESIRGR